MNSQHGRFPEDERDYALSDRERHFDTYRDRSAERGGYPGERSPERDWMHVPQPPRNSHTGLIVGLIAGFVVLPLVVSVGWIAWSEHQDSKASSTATRQTITAEQRAKWSSLGAGTAPTPPAGTDRDKALMDVGVCSGALFERYGEAVSELPETTTTGAIRECLIDILDWTKG